MSNPSDFVIENGVLKEYKGPGGDVVVPEGVTCIGDFSFYDCSSLVSVTLPEGLKSIGEEAFSGCSSLTSVTLPEGLTSIGRWAFYGCSSLKSITLPEGVTNIGGSAFWGCSSLTSITLPEGLMSIGAGAFGYSSSLTSITLPEGLTSIESSTFSGCSSLMSITLPEGLTSIGDWAFHSCSNLTSITLPEGVTSIGEKAFFDCCSLQSFVLNSKKAKMNVDVFGEKLPAGLAGSVKELYPNMSDGALKQYVLYKDRWETLDETLREEIFLSRQGKALESAYTVCVTAEQLEPLGKTILAQLQMPKPSTKDCAASAAYMTLFFESAPLAILQSLYQGLQQAKNGAKALKTVNGHAELMNRLRKSAEEDSSLLPVEQRVSEVMLAENLNTTDLKIRLKEFYALSYPDLPKLRTSDKKEPAQYVLAWLLMAHEKLIINQWGQTEVKAGKEEPELLPEAAEIVSMLDRTSLDSALMGFADQYFVQYENSRKKYLTYPFCRYADEAMMTDLTRRAPKWRSSVSGDNAPPLREFRDAVMFSNTRAAMLFAERYHELDKYAALRGMTEDELRDRYLSDVGLDEQGGKSYDLGNQTVTARLQKDLSFLVELPDGKIAKSLPKKGADPEKYETANTNFSELKKNAKKILKSRSNVLFEDFLSGRERPSADWQEVYLRNPLLRMAASLVVWAQGKQTFTLTEAGPIDSAGQPYAITDEPVKVAHPMEMDAADVTAWQKYFTKHGFKQPFAQVWEPVHKPEEIAEDRYAGSVQGLYSFSGKEKHGIHGGSIHAFSEEFGFSLDDCELEYEASTWRLNYDDFADVTFTLGKFTFPKYTRKVNHIVSILDKMTVWDRVKKDDVTVMDLMPGFTLAQITEFISAAQEANAANVLAALLEYKNDNFADFDPMDEFTLEW